MKYTIDRVEENIAVCETENGNVLIPVEKLPENVVSGDILVETGNGFIIDEISTENAREKNFSLFNKLKAKGKNHK